MLPTPPSVTRAFGRARCLRDGVVVVVAMSVAGCHRDDTVAPLEAPDGPLLEWTAPSLRTEPSTLVVPTYEGSGQGMHPDIVEFSHGWNGSHYWLAMTPYAGDDVKRENPSLLVSDDGNTLGVPSGVTNPLIPPLGVPNQYNSDPDLVYDAPRGEMVLSYRVVKDGTNTIKVVTSTNGRTWSAPRVAFSEPSHGAVSQSIVPATKSTQAMAWYVNAGKQGCGARSTQVMMRRAISVGSSLGTAAWSDPVATDLAQPGYVIWHLKIRYIPAKREYWALYVAYPADGYGCGGEDLFLAHSTNGLHWEGFPEPVLRHEDRDWSMSTLYRGTFLYDAQRDELSMWFSARSDAGIWRILYARFEYSMLAARLSRAPAAYQRAGKSGSGARHREIWRDAP